MIPCSVSSEVQSEDADARLILLAIVNRPKSEYNLEI